MTDIDGHEEHEPVQVPEDSDEGAASQRTELVSDIAATAASMSNAVDRVLLAYTASQGLLSQFAQIAELQRQSGLVSRAVELSDAARMANALMAISPGSVEVARQHEAVIDATRQTVAADAAVRDIAASASQIMRQFVASIGPLLEIRPDLRTKWEPPNWPEMSVDEEEAAVVILNDGIPLVWVPRAEIVTQLIAASDHAGREAILVASRDDIAADCADALAEIKSRHLRDLTGLAGSAVETLRAGLCPGAQALAANIFDTWLRDAAARGIRLTASGAGKGFYGKVKGQIAIVDDETLIAEYQEACVLPPALKALEDFDPRSGLPPRRFGRHATSHRAGPDQYTDVNAVIAVMLTVSILRQAEESGW